MEKLSGNSSNNNYNQIYDNNLFNIYYIPEIFINKLMTTCFRWPQPLNSPQKNFRRILQKEIIKKFNNCKNKVNE